MSGLAFSKSVKKDYRLSFGAGGSLYVIESKIFINIFLDSGDWSKVLDEITNNNVLQFNSDLTTNRRARELCLRLQSLSSEELLFYPDADFQDQSILSWITLCRTYEFIRDFTSKVVLEAFSKYRLELTYADYDFFFEDEKQWHPELEQIAEITRKKLRQVLFKMMKEAGLLTSENKISPLFSSSHLRNLSQSTQRDIISFIPGGDT